jgi:hypothetical protein
VARQNGDTEVMYGLGYENVMRGYKYALVDERNPSIVAFGASRVMQFRSSFFANPKDFINAGGSVEIDGIGNITGTVGGAQQYLPFLDQLPPNNRIKVLIVSLDPFAFHPLRPTGWEYESDTFLERLKDFLAGNWRSVYSDYFNGKFTLSSFAEKRRSSPAIGMGALMADNGFLNDGSWYEGRSVENPDQQKILTQNIQDKVVLYSSDRAKSEYGTGVNQRAISDINAFLAACKAHNIYVIGFIPPFPHAVYETLVSPNDAVSHSVTQLPNDLNAVFQKYGYAFFDYTDGASAGIKETEYLDDYHTSDKGDLRIMLDMSERDKTLATYVSIPTLKKMLNENPGNFLLTSPPKSQ